MKVKVCFLCGQYTPIHPNDPVSDFFLEDFLGWHYKHPIQTINLEEIPKDFQCITPQNREEALKKLAQERLSFI